MGSTTLKDLLAESCLPQAKGSACLVEAEVNSLISLLPEWDLSIEGTAISCTYKFKNYYETMSFLNAAAWIAHQQDHHPDILVTYNKSCITYSTHSVGGLSRNDFICAAKTDYLC